MQAPLELLGSVRRQVLIRRRAIVALCLALAAWSGLNSLTATAPSGVGVLTATRDLPSGTSLGHDDLHLVRFAPGSVPPAALRSVSSVLGRTLLVPLGRGDALTSAKLLGRRALDAYPDSSAIGLRIPDEDSAALLDPGDRVDLVASDPQGDAEPERLVRDAVVLAVPRPDPDAARIGAESGGRLVLFAVPRADAAHVAAVASSHYLTIIWNR